MKFSSTKFWINLLINIYKWWI